MHAESSDTYPHVVAVLDAKHRVIECAARIQWIIQVRNRETRHPWAGVSFCRTREALLRLAGPHPALLALPERYQEPVSSGQQAGDSEKSHPARPRATPHTDTRPTAAPCIG
jgi:hypothetical protein